MKFDRFGKRRIRRPRGKPGKLTDKQVHWIRELAKMGIPYRLLGPACGVSHVAAWKAANQPRWSDTV